MALSRKRKVLRTADNAVDVVAGIVLILLLLIGAYSIWDNVQIETAASSGQWKAYKPDIPETYNFDALKAENPDVIGWIELYGTDIDYPLLYSSDQDKYLTLNAKGEYSLAGSIFLDAKSDPHFNDLETIIYGHHMENELMFGPLDHYADNAFLAEHRYGKLTYDDEEHGLDVFAFIKTDAYDETVYRRGIRDVSEEAAFVAHLRELADPDSGISVTGEDKIVILSTCASEEVSGRTIVVAKITDNVPENTFTHTPNTGTGIDGSFKILGLVWYIWIPILIVPILIIILLVLHVARSASKKKLSDKGEDGGEGKVGSRK